MARRRGRVAFDMAALEGWSRGESVRYGPYRRGWIRRMGGWA